MYFLTVYKNKKEIIRHMEFNDYSEAVRYCNKFYKLKSTISILTFTTEIINGEFARSFTELNRPEDIDLNETYGKERYHHAAKHVNSFDYDASFFFLIESEVGINDPRVDEED
ncbi:MAG: hypothetical protein AAGA60_28115 [Cyanobacteria bacterium P01_E01_bin.42]